MEQKKITVVVYARVATLEQLKKNKPVKGGVSK